MSMRFADPRGQRILALMKFARIKSVAIRLMVCCGLLCSSCERRDSDLTVEEPPRGDEKPAIPAPAKLEPLAQLPIDPTVEWSQIDNPSADGWGSEVFSDRATAQLTALADLFFHDGDPGPLLAPGFTTDKLFPGPQAPVFKDASVEIERMGETGGGDLGRSLASVRSQLDGGEQGRHFKFKVVGVVQDGGEMATQLVFSLAFQNRSAWVEVHANWNVRWLVDGEALLIAGIGVTEFERSTTRREGSSIFSDVTTSAIGGNDCYHSQLAFGMNHWLGRLPVRAMLNRFGTPGLALGDVDGDGLEDLYLCQEPGLPNRLFLQGADGSAREVSAEWGVDWIEDSRSALLLDLDNDGDQDLAVAIYGAVIVARNDGRERFSIAGVLPASGSTASLAAADYDRDGLLDLFVCGYAREDSGASMGAAGDRFVYHDAENGAPNSLFRNQGDLTFVEVTDTVGLNQHNTRWSFAASWEDFDNDGDQDLYVANDYGRNNLYRNDGGQFADIAAETGVEDSASGMSVAWGDYDRDGRMDLYVSNMFSAAGSRITSQQQFRPGESEEIRSRFRRFARGNSLFRNAADGQFEDLSLSAGVNLGRWAWGSNFIDLNNDSWQDLVVANGYLSADGDSGDL